MQWPLARSPTLTLMALGVVAGTTDPSARGQEAKTTPASNADAAIAKRVEVLDKTIGQHIDAGRIAEAIPPAREKLDLLVRLRGKDHWQTGDARRDLETYERLAARPREVQDRFAEARRAMGRGEQLHGQGQYSRASEPLQEALAIDREILGEGHSETATNYIDLADTLWAQGKLAEAEAMHRRALAIRLKALPEGHPDIAQSYNNLAVTLAAQAKHAEAEAMHRRALAIFLKALPEGHPDIANSYNNLAVTLRAQGKHADAEAMHRRALAI